MVVVTVVASAGTIAPLDVDEDVAHVAHVAA
jgi:hypothetical protein